MSIRPIFMASAVVLCMVGLCASSAQDSGRVIHLSDSSGLYQSSLKGDQAQLLQVANTASDGPHIVAKALYERSIYQLDESSKTVSACADPSQIAHSTANWSCALILAGNKLLAGDVAGWARLMDITKKTVTPILAAHLHAGPNDLHIAEFETVPNFSKFFDFPAISVQRSAGDFSIPIDWIPTKDSSDSIQPFISVSINGHSLRMALDTGTSGVILSQSDASSLKVSDIHHGWASTSQGQPTDLGVIKDMTIGKLHISNMPTTITESPVSVLGIRGMQFLGAIRVHGDVLYSNAGGFGDSCKTPMDMASWVEGSNNALLVPGHVGDESLHFFLDSGNAWSVIRHTFGSPSDADHAKPISLTVGGVARPVYVSEARDTMQIGDLPPAYQDYKTVYSDQHTRFRYDIGGSFLHQHDLIIDFNHGVMCIAK